MFWCHFECLQAIRSHLAVFQPRSKFLLGHQMLRSSPISHQRIMLLVCSQEYSCAVQTSVKEADGRAALLRSWVRSVYNHLSWPIYQRCLSWNWLPPIQDGSTWISAKSCIGYSHALARRRCNSAELVTAFERDRLHFVEDVGRFISSLKCVNIFINSFTGCARLAEVQIK